MEQPKLGVWPKLFAGIVLVAIVVFAVTYGFWELTAQEHGGGYFRDESSPSTIPEFREITEPTP